MAVRKYRDCLILFWYSLIFLEKSISFVKCTISFFFFFFKEIFFMKTEITVIHFLLSPSVFCINTYVYFNMNFHATFLKQFLYQTYIIIFQCYQGSFTKYMCNAYILVYIQCNMTVHICDMLCLINYNFFSLHHYCVQTCLVWQNIYYTCSKHNVIATKHIQKCMYKDNFKLHLIKPFFTSSWSIISGKDHYYFLSL